MSAPLPQPPSLPPWLERRPEKRSECPPPDQQCPWVSCRHHLAFDLKKRRHYGPNTHTPQAPDRLILALPEDPADWPDDAQTCSLHVADGGAHTLDEVGSLLGNISRERVRQLEQSALAKLARMGIILNLADDIDLDTSTRAPRNQRPSAESKGHHAGEWRPRSTDPELDGTYVGAFRSQDMTAKMRRIQAESAPPVRSVTLPPEEIARIEAEIRAKQAPPRANATNARVTSDTFAVMAHDPRAAARYARSRESLRSFRRIEANDTPAKAPPTTPPRTPSPPSTTTLEIPPADLPTTIQSDDQPEAAVAAALPDPSPQETPMAYPPTRNKNAPHAQAASQAIRDIMAERQVSKASLIATCQNAYPTSTHGSTYTSVTAILSTSASPVSVWYRRIADVLGVALADLCDDPEWLAAVTPEASPRVTSHTSTPPPPAKAEAAKVLHLPTEYIPDPDSPDAPPLVPQSHPVAELQRAASALLAHCTGQDKRISELSAVADLLRQECDDLRQQLAAATKERDAATNTLATIRKSLGVA